MSSIVIRIEMNATVPANVKELHSAGGVAFARIDKKEFATEKIEFDSFLLPFISDSLGAISDFVADDISSRLATKSGKNNYASVVDDIFIDVQ